MEIGELVFFDLLYAMFLQPTLLTFAAFGCVMSSTAGSCRQSAHAFAMNLALLKFAVADLALLILHNLPSIDSHHEVVTFVTAQEDVQCVAVRLNTFDHSRTCRHTRRLLCANVERERHTSKKYKRYFFHLTEMFVVSMFQTSIYYRQNPEYCLGLPR